MEHKSWANSDSTHLLSAAHLVKPGSQSHSYLLVTQVFLTPFTVHLRGLSEVSQEYSGKLQFKYESTTHDLVLGQ